MRVKTGRLTDEQTETIQQRELERRGANAGSMTFYSNGKRISPRKKVIRICLEYRGATACP